jgi:energy-coupling factor transporter ATP-binding protein EcfA2
MRQEAAFFNGSIYCITRRFERASHRGITIATGFRLSCSVQDICMAMTLRISSLTANSGDMVTVPQAGVTCIVGANNAGKSQLLREIKALICDTDPPLKVLQSMEIIRPQGSDDEVKQFLDRTAPRYEDPYSAELSYGADGIGNQSARQISGWMDLPPQGSYTANMPMTGPYFLRSTSAGSLRDYATGSISTADQINSSPLSKLFRDGTIEEELSNLAEAAFESPVILDRLSPHMTLRVGRVTVPVPPLNRPTSEYAAAVSSQPALLFEGDGLKSFLGLALHVLSDGELLLLVDEPEAFLHPAQARALGRWLARKANEIQAQVILSTHDRDLILGLAEGGAPINVIRISRDGPITHLSQLNPSEVTRVWQDPVLRYSNVLQGLFHSQVVVCESDGDCRFFSASLDEFATDVGKPGIADDTLFVPSGGKDRIASLVQALSALEVRTWAFADFDVLQTRATVRSILDALHQTWTSEMASDYVTLAEGVNRLTESSTSSWQLAKHQGLQCLPAGQAFSAGQRLLANLAAAGLVVLPNGEMEDLDKSLPGHGASWVSDALVHGVHRSQLARVTVSHLVPSAT